MPDESIMFDAIVVGLGGMGSATLYRRRTRARTTLGSCGVSPCRIACAQRAGSIGLARATVVFDGFAGAEGASHQRAAPSSPTTHADALAGRIAPRAVFLVHPIEPALTLIRAYTKTRVADMTFGILGSLLWGTLAFLWGRRCVSRLMRDT